MMRAKQSVNTRGTIYRPRQEGGILCPRVSALIILVLIVVSAQAGWAAQSLTVSQATGGIPFSGTGPYLSQFGTMNALGIGTPATGVSVIPLTTGALYFTPYTLTGSVNGNHTITVSALI